MGEAFWGRASVGKRFKFEKGMYIAEAETVDPARRNNVDVNTKSIVLLCMGKRRILCLL